jgi:hypothetical protein
MVSRLNFSEFTDSTIPVCVMYAIVCQLIFSELTGFLGFVKYVTVYSASFSVWMNMCDFCYSICEVCQQFT